MAFLLVSFCVKFRFGCPQKRINLKKAFVMTALIEKGYPFPLYFSYKRHMSDEELFEFCAVNKHLRIERDEHDQLIIMAPTGGETGNQHIEIATAINNWNKQSKLGKTFDSSTGFQLPDNSMRSPDVAWITIEKWNSLSAQQKERFLPFAPDFVVEVLSPTDHLQLAKEKMRKWIQNGSRLGWLIAPKNKQVLVYRTDESVSTIEGFDKKLSGEDVLPGFEFDLSVLL